MLAALLDIRVLGPVACTLAGEPVRLERQQPRALLALLAMHPDAVVPRALIDAELGPADGVPASAAAVHSAVARLRAALTPGGAPRHRGGVVTASAMGYRLVVPAGAVDAHRFEAAVVAARAASDVGRAAQLACALEEWRGEPFADIHAGPVLSAERERLRALRLDVLEALLGLRLVDEGPDAVLADVERLAQEHPVREHLLALWMLALYRAGRQVDALHAYVAGRRRLVDELGVEPGPAVRRVHAAILAQDVDVVWPVGAARPLPTTDGLPAPATSFIGRLDELQQLGEAMATARLVSVIGVGGIGKTRLVVQLLRRDPRQVPAVFVPLGDCVNPDGVARALLHALHRCEGPARTPLEQAVAAIGERPMTLVLDQCEHVLDAATTVASSVLRACRYATVVATSRTRLGGDGEAVIQVGPMATAAATGGPPADAVRLFLERARAASREDVTGAALATVEALVRDLDGHPLAIELAAAQLAATELAALRAALPEQLLAARRRGGQQSHHSLDAVLASSLCHLGPRTRALMPRLAVFPGTFDRSGAAAVWEVPPPVADRHLRALQAASLLEGVAPGAWRLLRPLRLAAAQVVEHPTGGARLHAAWVAEEADALRARRFTHPGEVDARGRALHADAVAALDRALRDGEPALACRIGAGFAWPWFLHRAAEGVELLERVAGVAAAVEPAVAAQVWIGVAHCRWSLGDVPTAEAAVRRARELAPDDPDVDVFTTLIASVVGMPSGAQRAAAAALAGAERARAAGNPWGWALLTTVGAVCRFTGVDDAAVLEATREAEEVLGGLGDEFGRGFAQLARAQHAIRFGDSAQKRAALGLLASSSAITLRFDIPQGRVTTAVSTARLMVGLGHPDLAARALGVVDAVARSAGDSIRGVAPELAGTEAEVCAALGADRFAQLRAEGATAGEDSLELTIAAAVT
jgi:DNA-binding SARP family transcriptional activator/predicted ATPase